MNICTFFYLGKDKKWFMCKVSMAWELNTLKLWYKIKNKKDNSEKEKITLEYFVFIKNLKESISNHILIQLKQI